jgi:hypothetical protein
MIYFWAIWMVGVPLAVYFMRDLVTGKDNHKYPLVFCSAFWPIFLTGLATWKAVSYFTNLKGTQDVT